MGDNNINNVQFRDILNRNDVREGRFRRREKFCKRIVNFCNVIFIILLPVSQIHFAHSTTDLLTDWLTDIDNRDLNHRSFTSWELLPDTNYSSLTRLLPVTHTQSSVNVCQFHSHRVIIVMLCTYRRIRVGNVKSHYHLMGRTLILVNCLQFYCFRSDTRTLLEKCFTIAFVRRVSIFVRLLTRHQIYVLTCHVRG